MRALLSQLQLSARSATKESTDSSASFSAVPEMKVKIHGQQVNREKLSELSQVGILLGLFSKTTFDRINDGDKNPATKKVESFKNNHERLSALAAMIEKATVTFKYQDKSVTATLSELNDIFQYGMTHKLITLNDMNRLGVIL